MLRFECDYGEGAHPKILERLLETNLEQTPGYGKDEHCERAKTLIRQACGLPQSTIEFVTGGTQANQIVIAAILKPYQGVVCADTGHINTHETGAVEATGHKVLALPSKDGKISAQQIAKLCAAHWTDPSHEHTVQPGLVYLSQPTELGTLYTKAELKAIHQVCWQRHIPLYIDGARCGYGLAAPENDVTLADLAQLSDVFYIGGTKVGALLGEAVVIPNLAIQRDFRYMVKRMGGMLDPAEVGTAVLETSGAVSVFPKAQCRPVSPQDLGLKVAPEGLPLPLVLDGKVNRPNLSRGGLTESWLSQQLRCLGYDSADAVLFCCLNTRGQLMVQGKGKDRTQLLQALENGQAGW